VTEIALPAPRAAAHRRPRLGYAMTFTAAALFAFNGVVSKVILTSAGIEADRLTQLRTTGAFIGLAGILVVAAPRRLLPTRRELPMLVFYGICGFALVQWLYFLAIERLPVGIALLIQFTAPVLVALWARFVRHERMRRRIWAALALSLFGLGLVAQVWQGLSLDDAGVVAALAAAVALAIYFLVGEHGVGSRDPLSLVCLAMLVAALFWAVLQPWWSFPFETLTESVSLLGNLEDVSLPVWLLALWMIVLGTIAPFALSIASLQHLPATIVGVAAMAEPPLAALAAFLWLDETLAAAQLAGGAVVLAGIGLAQTARLPSR
jgi:drug/metabolite transporter (DMT)-like permease